MKANLIHICLSGRGLAELTFGDQNSGVASIYLDGVPIGKSILMKPGSRLSIATVTRLAGSENGTHSDRNSSLLATQKRSGSS